MDEDEYTYEAPKALHSVLSVTIPLAVLLVVIAIVSGLVFGGVIQGDEERVGPAEPPTTQSTILIEP